MKFNIDQEIEIGDTPHYPIKPSQALDLDLAKKHFNRYLTPINDMVCEAEKLVVNNEQTNETATFLGTSAKQILKKIEDERMYYVGEPNNYVKSVNAFVKIFTDKLKHVETLMKEKIAAYRAIQEQNRKEAELALQKATAELQKKLDLEAKEKGIEPTTLITPSLPKQPPVTRTETGSSYGRKVWTFEIIEPRYIRQIVSDLEIYLNKGDNIDHLQESISKLKTVSRYLVFSEKEIRDAIQAGVREIPGVRIYQAERTTFRT